MHMPWLAAEKRRRKILLSFTLLLSSIVIQANYWTAIDDYAAHNARIHTNNIVSFPLVWHTQANATSSKTAQNAQCICSQAFMVFACEVVSMLLEVKLFNKSARLQPLQESGSEWNDRKLVTGSHKRVLLVEGCVLHEIILAYRTNTASIAMAGWHKRGRTPEWLEEMFLFIKVTLIQLPIAEIHTNSSHLKVC